MFSVKFGINKHPFLCRSDEQKFENIILKKYFGIKIEIFDIENFGNFQNPENPKKSNVNDIGNFRKCQKS